MSALSSQPRARDLGIPFEGTPGRWNAITDVAGVEVGHATVIHGEGALEVGVGPARTGVTAIFPRGKQLPAPVFAGWHSLNGYGELTGTLWIEESGFLEGPVLWTNTSSVGTVRDAAIRWMMRHLAGAPLFLPVVGETYDGHLSDIHGFHVKEEHVFAALDGAASGPVAEGSVGGGTGMTSFEFKAGIGTASRVLSAQNGGYTVGVLVQSNYGLRDQLLVAGLPVGREILDGRFVQRELGSILILGATDAPLLPHQLDRLTRRMAMGLARTGSISGNSSGDIFLAFSTAEIEVGAPAAPMRVSMLPNTQIDPLFHAVVHATEEAILNALVAARTMTGRDQHTVFGLPHERMLEILRRHQRV